MIYIPYGKVQWYISGVGLSEADCNKAGKVEIHLGVLNRKDRELRFMFPVLLPVRFCTYIEFSADANAMLFAPTRMPAQALAGICLLTGTMQACRTELMCRA